jgi:hypothetical protein
MKGTITSITTAFRGDVVILTIEVVPLPQKPEYKIRTRTEAEVLADEIESLKRAEAAKMFHLGEVDIRQNEYSSYADRIEILQSRLDRLNKDAFQRASPDGG